MQVTSEPVKSVNTTCSGSTTIAGLCWREPEATPGLRTAPKRFHPNFEPGDIFTGSDGKCYTIESRIGSGGMGVVYRAHDPENDCPVAIKISTHSDRAVAKSLFSREAHTLLLLRHPNVPRLLDTGLTSADVPYLIMDLIPGRPLTEILESEQKLPIHKVLNICRQVARIIAYAHKQGICHNDLKPSNILIDQVGDQERVYVLDFGISSAQGIDTIIENRVMAGTICYMSPEQVTGHRTTPVSDIYQLGLVFFHCFLGELPFEAPLALDYRLYGEIIADRFYERLSSHSPAVELFIIQTLQRDEAHRLQSMQIVLERLDAIWESERRVC